MVDIANAKDGPGEIVLKYVVSGHTRVTADSIHGQIEERLE